MTTAEEVQEKQRSLHKLQCKMEMAQRGESWVIRPIPNHLLKMQIRTRPGDGTRLGGHVGKNHGKSQLQKLIERDGLKCCWCHKVCDLKLGPNADLFPTREHIIRLSDGGSNAMSNLALACKKCNNSRNVPAWKPPLPDNAVSLLVTQQQKEIERLKSELDKVYAELADARFNDLPNHQTG